MLTYDQLCINIFKHWTQAGSGSDSTTVFRRLVFTLTFRLEYQPERQTENSLALVSHVH